MQLPIGHNQNYAVVDKQSFKVKTNQTRVRVSDKRVLAYLVSCLMVALLMERQHLAPCCYCFRVFPSAGRTVEQVEGRACNEDIIPGGHSPSIHTAVFVSAYSCVLLPPR